MLKAPELGRLERRCSMGSVWGCSEKVPAATGQGVENDRGRVAIGVFWG
jgi:hypothetical protein